MKERPFQSVINLDVRNHTLMRYLFTDSYSSIEEQDVILEFGQDIFDSVRGLEYHEALLEYELVRIPEENRFFCIYIIFKNIVFKYINTNNIDKEEKRGIEEVYNQFLLYLENILKHLINYVVLAGVGFPEKSFFEINNLFAYLSDELVEFEKDLMFYMEKANMANGFPGSPLLNDKTILDNAIKQNEYDELRFRRDYSKDKLLTIFRYLIEEEFIDRTTSKDEFFYWFGYGDYDGSVKKIKFIAPLCDLVTFINNFYLDEKRKWLKTRHVFLNSHGKDITSKLSSIASKSISSRLKSKKELFPKP